MNAISALGETIAKVKSWVDVGDLASWTNADNSSLRQVFLQKSATAIGRNRHGKRDAEHANLPSGTASADESCETLLLLRRLSKGYRRTCRRVGVSACRRMGAAGEPLGRRRR